MNWSSYPEMMLKTKALYQQLERMQQRIRQPKCLRHSRPVVEVPCLSLSVRRKFLPYALWRKVDGSLLECGILGLCLLVSLPKWRNVK